MLFKVIKYTLFKHRYLEITMFFEYTEVQPPTAFFANTFSGQTNMPVVPVVLHIVVRKSDLSHL